MCSFLGVSIEKKFSMNSLSVPRKAKEAAGAIVKLQVKDGKPPSGGFPASIVINCEYSNLNALLADQGGDCAINDQNDSAYPGNCNVLLFELSSYVKTLEESNG